MKLKQLLLLLLIGIGNLQAQSDATLEETINWLNQHSLSKQNRNNEWFDEKVKKIKLNNFMLEVVHTNADKYGNETGNSTGNAWRREYSIKNSEKLTIRTTDLNEFILVIRGHGNSLSFIYTDKDLALRTLYAFQHLYNLLGNDIKIENQLVDENKF